MFPVRPGAVYGVSQPSLGLRLLAEQQAQGRWVAVVGIPELGFAAGRHLGMDMDRTVVVSDPGPRWLDVLAAFIDSVDVVAVRPPTRVSDYEAARVAARLRKHRTILLSFGSWPRMEAQFHFEHDSWLGIGHGHGYLRDRQGSIQVRHRSGQVARAG